MGKELAEDGEEFMRHFVPMTSQFNRFRPFVVDSVR